MAQADTIEEEVNPAVTTTADVLGYGLPLAGLALTYFLSRDEEPAAGERFLGDGWRDWTRMNGNPRHDLALAVVRTELVTYGLKYALDEERPNGKDGSFPSGHTSTAFAGAEFIRKEYGLWWGVPAYLAASVVGWSRLESNHHWPKDILAGAAIGILANHDFSELGRFRLVPGFVNSDAGWHGDGSFVSFADAPSPDFSAPGLRFELRF